MAAVRSQVALVLGVLAAMGLYAYAFSDETPTGGLQGRVMTADTRAPLAGIKVYVRPKTPEHGADTQSATTRPDGTFTVNRLPVGAYEVQTATSVYQNDPHPVAVVEGEIAKAALDLKPQDPFLNLNVHQHAYTPGENPRIAIHGFRQGNDLRLKLLQVDGTALIRDHGGDLRRLLDPVSSTGKPGAFQSLRNGKLKKVKEWGHRVTKRDAEGVFYEFVHLGKLPPGVYLISAQADKSEGLGWLMVTDLALVTKTSTERTLLYSVDLRTGKPVPGVPVGLYTRNQRPQRAVTDARGLAELKRTGDDETTALAHRGESLAFLRLYHYGGGGDKKHRVFTYTERPVYRPGHRVRFKGVVRRLEGLAYAVPTPRSVHVEVRDYQSTTLYEAQPLLNAAGSFFGEFEMPAEASTGHYTLNVKVDGEEHADDGFVVASYRKPEWKVEVRTPKTHYIRGDRVPALIHAEYYFGAPVAAGKVRYTVYRSEYWRWWGSDDYYEVDNEESGAYGDVVAQGELKTDAGGEARFEFPTGLSGADDRSAEYQYRIEAEVSDATDRLATGEGKVQVSAGELVVDGRPEQYVLPPGQATSVKVRVQSLDEKPAPGVEVVCKGVLHTCVDNRTRLQELFTQSVTTDAQGAAVLPVQVSETGWVEITLTAKDRRGNRVEHRTDVYVSTADGGDYMSNYPDLAVIPDKKLYRAGDVAQVLINTDKPGATALVAVEAEKVLSYQLVPLSRKSTLVRIPVLSSYEPNVFVSACFVRGKEFVTSQARLNVNTEAHRLKVTVTSDREVYRPGDRATYQVKTTDHAGKPVAAEFSLGVVDESVYAIREEPARGLWEVFYPRRQDNVSTSYSFPNIYLGDANKDGAGKAVRKNFPDTAYWNPTLRTDASGAATVTVELPDSLTSWRATAVAHTARTEVGKATHQLRVSRDLVLRLQTPRALMEGDRLTLSAVAHNYTAAPLDAVVNLTAVGATVSGGERRVRVKPGEAERVEWDVTPTAPGTAVFTATASAGALADGMELKVPVRPFAQDRLVYRTGAVTDAPASEALDLEPGVTAGDLEVRLSPTLGGAMLGALDYLATYPYGCTEQTMSSFLPDVVIGRMLKDLSLRRPDLENRLPDMVRAGLLRLNRYQQLDGGWGWWEFDTTDPWMTAYVLYGLTTAREAGHVVNPQIYQNGVNAVSRMVKSGEHDPNATMFLAYALARAKGGGVPRAAIYRLLDRDAELERSAAATVPPAKSTTPTPPSQRRLHVRSRAYAALALATLGTPEDRQRAQQLVEELWGRALVDGPLAHWEEVRTRQWEFDIPQDVETTAVAALAVLQVTPDDARIPGVVRWLMLQRNGNRWQSTRDTAWILMALADYLKQSGELKPDYRLTVLVNGKEVHSENVRPGDALAAETIVRVPARDLAATNRLEIRKEGAGVVYYTARLEGQLRAPTFNAETSLPGLSVKREYFKMESRRDPAGRPVTAPGPRPIQQARVGDRILVRLTLHTDRKLQYLMLEDPIPAGFEVQERGEITRDEWLYWWTHQDIRDDRMSLFVRNLEPGKHTLEYYVRPEMEGTTRLLPAVLTDMYVPSTRASTADHRLEVSR